MPEEIINNIDKHFKGQQASEELQAVFRKHWIVLLPVTFGFLITIIMLGLVISYASRLSTETLQNQLPYQLMAIIVVSFFTYCFHAYFNRLLNYYLEIVIITNYRVISLEKSLFLKDEKDVIDLHEIQDIRKSQHGLTKNLLDYGELTIVMAGVNTDHKISHVPRPDKYFRAINLAKRNYIIDRHQQKLE